MTDIKETDYTQELAELLNFISSVAIAIRMNSTYGGGLKRNPHAEQDLMWLADSLHGLNSLGSALQFGLASRIASSCEFLLGSYEMYREPGVVSYGCEIKPTFDRHDRYFDLQEGIDILEKIRSKALAQVENKI